MSPLTPEAKKAISARVQFYRELGIHSFYRRSEAPVTEDEPIMAKASSAAKPAKSTSLNVINNETGKAGLLDAVRADIGDCTRCRLSKQRTNIVFGTGNFDADIMFIGEGPGADEDEQGLPFVGRAGQLLNNMISAMGIQREDVYIANVVKCRPPGNRTPERDECDTCSPFLMRQIAAIRPKAIVALGAVAAKTLLAINAPMAELRGRWYDFVPQVAKTFRSGAAVPPIKLAVTYHPAYLLRDPRQKKET